MKSVNNHGNGLTSREIIIKLLLINMLLPFFFLIVAQVIATLFNSFKVEEYTMWGRVAKYGIQPLILGIFFVAAIVVFFVIIKQARPLMNYISLGTDYEKARMATSRIPVLLIAVHTGLWVVGTLVFYMMTSFDPEGKIPFGWDIILVPGWGLVGAIYAAISNNILFISSRKRLNMIDIRPGENDWFVRKKDFLIGFAILLMSLATMGYFAYYYYKVGTDAPNSPPFIPALLILGGFLFIVFYFLIFLSKREYYRQLNFLKERLYDLLEGEGDLTQRLYLIYFDEIGEVTAQINQFLNYLHGFVSTVTNVVDTTQNSSSELQETILENEKFFHEFSEFLNHIMLSAENEQSQVKETTANTEEILGMLTEFMSNIENQLSAVDQTSSSINQLVSSIYNISEITGKTNEISEELSEKTNESSSELESFYGTIEAVETSSRAMIELINNISQIAETTNILALNASIEASHAGSAGKGFAVVANEIKKLAIQTTDSTGELIHHIKTMNEKTKVGMQKLHILKQTLESMYPRIEEIINQIKQIALKMDEDKEGADNIVSSVEILISSTSKMKFISDSQRKRSEKIGTAMEFLQRVSGETSDMIQELNSKFSGLKDANEKLKHISGINLENSQKLIDVTSRFKSK